MNWCSKGQILVFCNESHNNKLKRGRRRLRQRVCMLWHLLLRGNRGSRRGRSRGLKTEIQVNMYSLYILLMSFSFSPLFSSLLFLYSSSLFSGSLGTWSDRAGENEDRIEIERRLQEINRITVGFREDTQEKWRKWKDGDWNVGGWEMLHNEWTV